MSDPKPSIYHRRKCPFCRRLRAYLTEKSLDAELIDFDPDEDIDRLRALNPKAQVPTYDTGRGLALFESFLIMEYLEETHPEPRLLPEDAEERAVTRLLFDLADHHFTPSMIGFVRAPYDHPSRPELAEEVTAAAWDIERLLAPDATYALGERFTAADLSLPPLLYRCIERGFVPDLLPDRVRQWSKVVLKRPSVAALYPKVKI